MKVSVISDVAVSRNLRDPARFPTCAYPAATLAGDGKVVCAYRGGSEKHSYDGVLLAQRSGDSGETWSEPAAVFDGQHLAPPRCAFSGGICRTPDGALLADLWVVEVTRPDDYIFSDEGRTQRCFYYIISSADGGATWSAPSEVDTRGFDEACPTSNPMVLPDGGIFMPVETRSRRTGILSTAGSVSLDNGETWGPLASLGLDDPAGELELCDARFAFVKERILAMLWTFRSGVEQDVEVHRSFSDDCGRTWTEPQPTGFVAQVTAPLWLGDDVVIAAGNCRRPPDGIRLWASSDGGQTWPDEPIQMWDALEKRIVGEAVSASGPGSQPDGVWDALPKFTFGTPSLTALGDRSVLLTYYATVNEITHIRACRFKVEC